MITGKVSDSLKKAYINVPGKGLSSNLGGSTIHGIGTDVDNGKDSTLGLHRLVSMMGTESNNVLTSSIDSSSQNSFQNGPSISPRGVHSKIPQRCD